LSSAHDILRYGLNLCSRHVRGYKSWDNFRKVVNVFTLRDGCRGFAVLHRRKRRTCFYWWSTLRPANQLSELCIRFDTAVVTDHLIFAAKELLEDRSFKLFRETISRCDSRSSLRIVDAPVRGISCQFLRWPQGRADLRLMDRNLVACVGWYRLLTRPLRPDSRNSGLHAESFGRAISGYLAAQSRCLRGRRFTLPAHP
jgi:hypothetical protein